MADYVMQYGLFLAQVATIVIAIAIAAGLCVVLSRRSHGAERLEVKPLNARYASLSGAIASQTLDRKALRLARREEKRRRKASRDAPGARRIFVINFRGDIRASAVASLREEVTAVLGHARPGDEVLVRLENAGGLVHDHGLAASQLLRIKARGIPLTVAVDKVAASGGYMMACVADRIIAAPFAVVGSIGVLAQVPNFRRMLDRHGVDVEQFKAGQYKRTVTLFGENSETDREKMRRDLEDIHALFKDFVKEHRGGLEIERVATGEHWYGRRALDLGLVDSLQTSDDYLLDASRVARLYEVRFVTRRGLGESLAALVQATVERLLLASGERLIS